MGSFVSSLLKMFLYLNRLKGFFFPHCYPYQENSPFLTAFCLCSYLFDSAIQVNWHFSFGGLLLDFSQFSPFWSICPPLSNAICIMMNMLNPESSVKSLKSLRWRIEETETKPFFWKLLFFFDYKWIFSSAYLMHSSMGGSPYLITGSRGFRIGTLKSGLLLMRSCNKPVDESWNSYRIPRTTKGSDPFGSSIAFGDCHDLGWGLTCPFQGLCIMPSSSCEASVQEWSQDARSQSHCSFWASLRLPLFKEPFSSTAKSVMIAKVMWLL